MRTINVSEEGFQKFLAIKEARPQDSSRAQTFDHILKFYEGKSVLPLQEKGMTYTKHINPANVASPSMRVMGVDGKEFIQIGGDRCDL